MSQHESTSDSELNKEKHLLKSSRIKRKRDDDFADELSKFKDEMRNMFSSLMKSQEQEFKNHSATLKEIQRTNTSIEESISFLSQQNEEFRKKIERLENARTEDKKYIALLEERLENMQLDSRKANFELKNVPKKQDEAKTDLIDMVLCMSNTIGCQMSRSEIKDVYRVRGKRNDANNTPIVVETTSTLLKNDILKHCKAFNYKNKNKLCAKHLGLRISEDNPVFVTEQLTAKAARLHFLGRDLVKSKEFKYCWTAYGRVYLRKEENSPVILVKNELQIQGLLTKT